MLFFILISLLPPIFDALGNIIDSKLSNTFGINSMVFFSVFFNILFLPLIFFFGIPQALPLQAIPFVIFFALVEVFYLYPYTLSLKSIDTSIVTALFNLGKIIVPILAFFIVGEVLSLNLYIGFFIIIFSAILLSLQQKSGKLHLNKAFFYMLICSLVLSFSSVLEKYILKGVDFITLFFWVDLISFLIILPFPFFPKIRNEIKKDYSTLKNNFWEFVLQALFAFFSIFSGFYAISMVPITLFKAISSLQILIVLFFSFIISKFHPQYLSENLSKKNVIKKVSLYVLILIAIFIMGY